MKKRLITCGILLLLLVVSLSGCSDNSSNDSSSNEGGSVAKAVLVMEKYTGEHHWDLTKGYYATVNLVVRNTGSASATDGYVILYSTDQDSEVECNEVEYLPTLSPGEVHGVSFTVNYEMGDTLLNNKITINWSGGSKEYSQVINL